MGDLIFAVILFALGFAHVHWGWAIGVIVVVYFLTMISPRGQAQRYHMRQMGSALGEDGRVTESKAMWQALLMVAVVGGAAFGIGWLVGLAT